MTNVLSTRQHNFGDSSCFSVSFVSATRKCFKYTRSQTPPQKQVSSASGRNVGCSAVFVQTQIAFDGATKPKFQSDLIAHLASQMIQSSPNRKMHLLASLGRNQNRTRIFVASTRLRADGQAICSVLGCPGMQPALCYVLRLADRTSLDGATSLESSVVGRCFVRNLIPSAQPAP